MPAIPRLYTAVTQQLSGSFLTVVTWFAARAARLTHIQSLVFRRRRSGCSLRPLPPLGLLRGVVGGAVQEKAICREGHSCLPVRTVRLSI